MASFQIRNLYCVTCDGPKRARIPIIDGVEQNATCDTCESPLFAISGDKPIYAKVVKFNGDGTVDVLIL